MTDEKMQSVQALEHQKRLIERQLEIKENEIRNLIMQAGVLRTKLTHLENERYRILGRQ